MGHDPGADLVRVVVAVALRLGLPRVANLVDQLVEELLSLVVAHYISKKTMIKSMLKAEEKGPGYR